MFKRFLTLLWKLPICAVAFYVGTMLGGMVAAGVGLPAPEMPAGRRPDDSRANHAAHQPDFGRVSGSFSSKSVWGVHRSLADAFVSGLDRLRGEQYHSKELSSPPCRRPRCSR